ncbi:MATE family efflux transporter [Desulfuromonas versatilis]|uniref:Multidrug-efflux transporter n=1 Tax=Desulfuromonas versatilis TaxID=2802975 RepID=A0ABM8HUK8_9BACT|nr:MATE family efflux transporter [Desulfuromonas versatilis]BCR05661.1 MATE family efflux transporter [Desulfuromonas versatilis]
MDKTQMPHSVVPTPGGMREMLAIALPMVVSHGCETLLIFTDRLFLSRLGPEQMSAAMAGGLTSFMMMTFFIGLTGYATALVAQYLGAGERQRCALVVSQALLIALVAYPLILAGRPLAHGLFALAGIAPEQLAPQRQYFDILLYGALPVLLRTCLASFFSGIGRTRVVMLAALVAMLVNVGANYLLIFGRFGVPALGIRGAAWGTLLGSLCGLAVLVAVYFGRDNRQAYGVLDALRLERAVMKKLLRFGSPAGVEMFLNLLAFTVMILIFHSHGLTTATAVTVVFNWDMVSFVPLIGIQIGVVSLVGRYLGASHPEIAERAAISGLKMGWIYSSVILLLFVCLPEQLVEIFRPQGADETFSQAAPLAVGMLRLASLYVLADAVMVVFSGALRAAGDTFWAMTVSVTMHWLLVPLLFVLLKVFQLPPQSAWLALIGLFLCFSGVFYLRYRSGRWKHLAMIGDEPGGPLAVSGGGA